MPEESARPVGPWGKLVALLMGVPPVAVLAADDDEDVDENDPPQQRPAGY